MWALPVQLRFDKWQSQIDAQNTYHDSPDTNANANAYESQSHSHSHSGERHSLLNHSQTRRRYLFLPFLVVSTVFLALLCTTSLLLSHSFPVAVSSKTLRLLRSWFFGSPSIDYEIASITASTASTTPQIKLGPTDTSVTATWENLKAGEHCLRYATREYTARLQVQVSDDSFPELPEPQAQDMLKLCRETPVRIHGRERWTSFCQDLGFGRGVWGFWVVDFEEPDCETTWGEFRDLGCTPSLTDESQDQTVVRRFSSHLENLQTGSSWQIMCTTTPADIEGHHFSTPLDCYRLARLGTYGVWDLEDGSCEELD